MRSEHRTGLALRCIFFVAILRRGCEMTGRAAKHLLHVDGRSSHHPHTTSRDPWASLVLFWSARLEHTLLRPCLQSFAVRVKPDHRWILVGCIGVRIDAEQLEDL